MHNHGCEHNLKYCRQCDVVYCTKCGREWGGYDHQHFYPYNPYIPWNTTDGNFLCNNIIHSHS
jgi:hypothetical protein